jgi:PAS domain S-box-containing protein
MHEPITEQPPTPALIEAPLRETHSRYSALFGFLQEAVFVADAETGMILDANPAAEELTGRSLSEIRTFHHSQLHPPEDAERARLAFASVLGQPTLSQGGDRLGEWDLRHAGGRKIPVDIFVTPWKGDDGTSLVLGVFRDLREQRHVSESLRRSEERFRQIAEVTGEFIWEVNSRSSGTSRKRSWASSTFTISSCPPVVKI